MGARKHLHAVDDDFSAGLQNFVNLAHDITSTRVDDGVQHRGPPSFCEHLGELTWPTFCRRRTE